MNVSELINMELACTCIYVVIYFVLKLNVYNWCQKRVSFRDQTQGQDITEQYPALILVDYCCMDEITEMSRPMLSSTKRMARIAHLEVL